MRMQHARKVQRGFSLIELLVVVVAIIVVTAISIPIIQRALFNMRMRSTAGELAGIMQQARITAAKSNRTFDIKYTNINGNSAAYVDVNQNGKYDAGEPVVVFNSGVTPAAGAPNGAGGQPSAYVLTGDSGNAPAYDNTNTLAFSPRGLPCNYDAPPACLTPSPSYFVYYLTSANGWGAVVVTRAGRTKVTIWDGTNWSD